MVCSSDHLANVGVCQNMIPLAGCLFRAKSAIRIEKVADLQGSIMQWHLLYQYRLDEKFYQKPIEQGR